MAITFSIKTRNMLVPEGYKYGCLADVKHKILYEPNRFCVSFRSLIKERSLVIVFYTILIKNWYQSSGLEEVSAREFLVCSVVAALSELPHQKRIFF